VLAQAAVRAEPPAGVATGVAAVVGGETITLSELDARALKSNMKLAQSLYDARRKVLDDLLMERLLAAEAKTKGVTAEELLKSRIEAKATPVTDADAKAYYDANVARMRGRTLEQVASQITLMLRNQRGDAARAAVLAELMKDASVKIVLDAPRADVVIAANDPMKGSKDAKVTIVEFSDFQ
jgi:protein-disulfide isomerase